MVQRRIIVPCRAKSIQSMLQAMYESGEVLNVAKGRQCQNPATGHVAGFDLCTLHVGILHVYGTLDVVPDQEIRLTHGACGLHLQETPQCPQETETPVP